MLDYRSVGCYVWIGFWWKKSGETDLASTIKAEGVRKQQHRKMEATSEMDKLELKHPGQIITTSHDKKTP